MKASPWTLPRGVLVVSSTFDFQYADSEFVDQGGARAFPLAGEFFGSGLALGARLGVTDRFELDLKIPVRLLSYQADPVVLQGQIIDFSQTGGGIADISVRGRYQLLRGRVVSAVQLGLQTPTGYQEPEGTFGREPTLEDLLERPEMFVRPENVRDDVVLGDGRLEIEAALLIGTAFDTGTFVRGTLGYALRLGGAGDQFRGELKVGQRLGSKFLLFAGAAWAVTVEEGESIGLSAIADDPSLPASGFADGQGIRLIERPLERDALDVAGGLVWRWSDDVEMNVEYRRTVWGRFTAATNVTSVGFLLRTDTVD